MELALKALTYKRVFVIRSKNSVMDVLIFPLIFATYLYRKIAKVAVNFQRNMQFIRKIQGAAKIDGKISDTG